MIQGESPSSCSFLLRLTPRSVTFEEYIYYAKIERAKEKNLTGIGKKSFSLKTLFRKDEPVTLESRPSPNAPGSTTNKETAGREEFGVVEDEEWYQAARALRTATWGAVFYLITTDILGPYTVPYVDSSDRRLS